MSYKEHKEKAPRSVTCMVLTVSDSRTPETDISGQTVMRMLKDQSHPVASYRIVKNDLNEIRQCVEEACADSRLQAIVIIGGTGISRRDVTIEAMGGLCERKLPGFGELFRHLSYQEIGSGAFLSRADAGIARGKVLFCLPGAERAVRLAVERLILPELGHLVEEVNR